MCELNSEYEFLLSLLKPGTPKESATTGALLLVGGVLILGGILVAQSLYPGYNASKSAISDLGTPIGNSKKLLLT